jgi:endogenous inhibitor of DNA gyrase (YacG/DUF329 family)
MLNLPKPCPFCESPPRAEFAPFCSKGCRDRDMLQWLGDGYRIPGPPAEEALDSLGLDRDDQASL